jgi:amino acid adenylation domain-containing protein
MPLRAAGPFEEFSTEELEQSIPERFEKQVARHAGGLAVKTAGWELTYRELDRFASRVARSILAKRGRRNEPVALLLEQDAPLLAAILGVLKSGNLYVPLDPGYPLPRLEEMLRHAGAETVIADDANLELATRLAAGVRSLLSMEAVAAAPAEDLRLQISPDAPAYIFYTSGSTGAPKGVVDCHRNVLHNIMRYTNGLRIGAADRLTLLQSPSFSGSVSSVFGALLNGAASFPLNPRRAGSAELAQWVRDNKLTMWHSVPSLFRQLCLGGGQFPSIRVIRLEGDQAAPGDVVLYRRHFSPECVLVNGLGATETGIVRRYFIDHGTEVSGGVVPIGYPVEDMDVLLLDEAGAEVDRGGTGEIAVRSRYLATGYWNNAERTARAFTRCGADPEVRLYRTGDLGRMRPDACLEYLGRKDFRIKIQGHTIEAGVVEAALCELEEVRQAVVAAAGQRHGEHILGAYLVLKGSATPTVSALRRRLAGRLPDHMIPSTFVILDCLPLNENGKVDRRRLPTPGTGRPRLDTPYAPPVTAAERRVAATWREVLGVDEPGIDDDFFELGGRSVDVARVLADLPVSVAAFVAQPTIRRIGAAVDAAGAPRRGLLVPVSAAAGKPALFCLPGHDGVLLGYANLARYIPNGRAVLALTPPPIAELGIPFRLEDLAARYAKEIRLAEPEGPYLLSGFCFGGLVAFEVARQLAEDGAEVALLVLVECPRPAARQPVENLRHWGRRAVYHIRAAARLGPRHLWRRAGVAVRDERQRLRLRALERCVTQGRPLPEDLRRLDVANGVAATEYVPRPYAGRTLLLGSAEPQAARYPAPLMGWDGLLAGEVETHLISDNLTGLLAEPTVRETARLLVRAMDGVTELRA